MENENKTYGHTGPEIIFNNVTKEYPNGVKALDNVSFRVAPGEFAFLMGHSGSGKSSLIKLLMLEERPTSGEIIVGSVDLNSVKSSGIPYYRRLIGIVFQDFRIIASMSVFENVAFALEMLGRSRKEIERQVLAALDLVGLSEKRDEKPDCLSGGEQQRVAIARAVVNLPGLIIADEPTGNLDKENSVEIMKLLMKINSMGTTVIVATHERDIVADIGQRVIELNHGVRLLGDE
ncbi:MAG: cell division ATP-binding protein FtsE [Clostridia bacterium]|nr:cell division ATP-binding protein FtsE [Clostridia bacterium]MCR5694707.1 cell division ATP-binding protein FtsE [Clostridia bacterium]